MDILSHLFFGFAMGFTGVCLPGMTNMTSVGMSLRQGLKPGMYYSAGASTTIFIQALIAITFAGYLAQNPEIFAFLEKAAIFIFIALSVVFFYLATRRQAVKSEVRKGSAFFAGMGVAGMNALTIPYYFTFSTLLTAKGLITLAPSMRWVFMAGAPLGSLILLSSYIFFARYIAERAEFISRYINFFLSGLFLLLSILQLARLLS
jgi:threonine/homoserine/homoserine lactone efflux protein